MSLWFQRGPLRCVLLNVQCRLYPWEKEGRSAWTSVDQVSSLGYFCCRCFWSLKNTFSAALHCPLSKEDRQKPKARLGFSQGVRQGREVPVSSPGPFSGHHLHMYHTPERPGPPRSCSVFRCPSTCPIAASRLGHTKQIYWR